MSEAWVTILALAATTAAIRASGPVALGGRDLPRPVMNVIALVAPALLAALVVTETLTGEPGELTVDESAAGVAFAGAVIALRGPLLAAIALAAGGTAGLRAFA
jgi:branched-subunit amino acid transport protein